MFAWQINEPKQIKKVQIENNLEQIDDVKVKITKCLVTRQDLLNFLGKSNVTYPIIPSKIAVGQITETLKESNYFVKGTKVYLSPEKPCKTCHKCLNNLENECLNVLYASKNFDGYLKEFAVLPKESAHILTQKTSYYDALFLNHISLALSVIDKLHISKGQHVCILGGSIFANIVAQLISYYQGVPIMIDNSEESLDIANKCGIYYSYPVTKNLEKQIMNITGFRNCSIIIFDTESDINPDWISKLCANTANVAISGMVDTKTKINFEQLFDKEIDLTCVKSSFNNISSSINLIVQGVLNLSCFDINEYKFDYADKHFENFATKLLNDSNKNQFIIDLM